MKRLDSATVSLLSRRVLDVAACCAEAGVTVSLNDHSVPIKSFEQYIDAYQLGYVKPSATKSSSSSSTSSSSSSDDAEAKVYDSSSATSSRFVFARNNHWIVAVRVVPDDGEAAQISFVNSIATSRGGMTDTSLMLLTD
jgi:DNA gyrase/topoisomerase IV subunit B